MQLTIEIPDELGPKDEAERERLAETVRRALGRSSAGTGVVQEVFEFLARNPSPEEILAFRPSQRAVERLGDLLDKNRQSSLTAEEETELDTMQSLDHLFALLKVQARQQRRTAP